MPSYAGFPLTVRQIKEGAHPCSAGLAAEGPHSVPTGRVPACTVVVVAAMASASARDRRAAEVERWDLTGMAGIDAEGEKETRVH